MLINEVVRATGLTRKAIYYYVDEKLVVPIEDLTNHYKHYSKDDVERLLVIAQLRKMHLTIKEIRTILESPERLDLVLHQACQKQIDEMISLANNIMELNLLLTKLPPNCHLKQLAKTLKDSKGTEGMPNYREHFMELFPGQEGRKYVLFLWEAFLNDSFDTKEQWDAWHEMVEYIDVALESEQLSGYETTYGVLSEEKLEEYYVLRKDYIAHIVDLEGIVFERKVQEIIAFVTGLPNEKRYLRLWNNDFKTLVVPIVCMEEEVIGKLLMIISKNYKEYQEQWEKLVSRLQAYLDSAENHDLVEKITDCMGESSIIVDGKVQKQYLMFLDFFKNSLYLI